MARVTTLAVIALCASAAACGGGGTPQASTPTPPPPTLAAAGFVTTEGPTPQGVVVKTTDGGATWQPMTVNPGVSFEGVAFVTRDRGWVGSNATLYSTSDGGATWAPLQFGRLVNRMRVLRSDLVYACGDRVYRWMP
jgi:photosystem II stability/assembly factor-like uncharacterized protein